MRRRRLLRTSAAALTLGFAGCGQGDDGTATPDDDTPTDPPASTAAVTDDGPTATVTPSPTAAPTESPTPTAMETSSSTPTATPSPTETASPTATETATPAPTPADAAQVVEVSPEDDSFSFDPASFEVAAGETVAWVWRTDGHNVRPDSTPEGSDWTGTPGGDSEVYDEGYEHAYTFETPGEYAYYCAPHEGLDMVGEFTVTE